MRMDVGLAIRTLFDVAPEGYDQALGCRGDVRDRRLEGGLVPSRGLAEAADLADVLASGGVDLAGRRGLGRAA
jgi:hypothetical protein